MRMHLVMAVLAVAGMGFGERVYGRDLEGRIPQKAAADGRSAAVVEEAKAQEAERPPKEGDTKLVPLPGGATMEMVWCPAGSFQMGSPGGWFHGESGRHPHESQHRVTLTKGFWLAKTEVTQKQWVAVMGDNPSKFKGEDLPVECVSWEDCQEFCRRAGHGLRLPTEAQWEYACRAGSTTAYCWGEELNGEQANCDGTLPRGTSKKGPSLRRPTPVGSYPPNAWGLLDMHGNVWEWCEDWYGLYPGGKETDPAGPEKGSLRIIRGGGWDGGAGYCRSAGRGRFGAKAHSHALGFRPASDQP